MPVQVIVGGNDALIQSRETRDRMERWGPNLRLNLERPIDVMSRTAKVTTAPATAQSANAVQRAVTRAV
jgi:hypothetical protein